jgi:hypothetical protein
MNTPVHPYGRRLEVLSPIARGYSSERCSPLTSDGWVRLCDRAKSAASI